METLERLRVQIKTTEDLQGVVRTMKALAAVGIHQNEHAVHALRIYTRAVELGLHVVFRNSSSAALARAGGGRVSPDAPSALVIFGSDHGLCGRFNDDVVDNVVANFLPALPTVHALSILAVGTRTAVRLEHAQLQVEKTLLVPGTASRITATVRQILAALDDWRARGTERVTLAFNQHITGARYEPLLQTLTPLDISALSTLKYGPWPSKVLPTHSMEREALLAALLRQYIFVNVFRACAESLASESGARLAAMHSAGRNLDERHTELSALFRRQRQTLITSQLLDVVNGYEALTAGQTPPDEERVT